MTDSSLVSLHTPPRSNLKELAADYLRELIFSGQLQPHDKIDQDVIAERLQISKLPVREALILLGEEGLLRNVARRGSFVAPLTATDVRDHYRIYALVSGMAANRAAAQLSDEELDHLGRILDELEAATDGAQQEKLNYDFHRRINRAAHSIRLHSALQSLSRTMPSRFYEYASGWSRLARAQHREIMDSLRARDGDRADAAMVEHLSSGADFAVALLESQNFWRSSEES